MQRFKTVIYIGWVLLLFIAYESAFAKNGIPTPKNRDVSEVLNQKLIQYDKSRSNFKSAGSKFSLNYSKNCGTISRPSAVHDPMVEQQNRLNAFKSVNQGPRGSEDFYGFSMKFPIEQK